MIGAGDKADSPTFLEDIIEKIFGIKSPNQKSFKQQLEEEGMMVVYKDNVAVIYRK